MLPRDEELAHVECRGCVLDPLHERKPSRMPVNAKQERKSLPSGRPCTLGAGSAPIVYKLIFSVERPAGRKLQAGVLRDIVDVEARQIADDGVVRLRCGLDLNAHSPLPVLRQRPRDHLVDRQHLGNARRRVPRAPDVLPALRAVFAGADVDVLADVDGAAGGQIVGVEAGGFDRGPQHVGLQAGEGGGQQNVVGAARDQHVLVSGVRHALARRDELGAHVSEVAAERLGGAQRVAVADAAGQHQRAVEERPHRAHEHERIEPAGLAAGARRQQHQPVGAGRDRALGVTDTGDIGEHDCAGIVQRF